MLLNTQLIPPTETHTHSLKEGKLRDERSKQRISQIGVRETVRVDYTKNVEKEFGSDRIDLTE